MYAELIAAISSTKTALEIAKAAKELSNFNELVSAVSEVNAKLMDATSVALTSQEKHAALLTENLALKDELERLKSWATRSKDYVLQAVGVEGKHFAQVYKPSTQTPTARHWACVKCFEDRKVYPLSVHERYSYRCPNCGTEIAPIIVGGLLAPIESAYSLPVEDTDGAGSQA